MLDRLELANRLPDPVRSDAGGQAGADGGHHVAQVVRPRQRYIRYGHNRLHGATLGPADGAVEDANTCVDLVDHGEGEDLPPGLCRHRSRGGVIEIEDGVVLRLHERDRPRLDLAIPLHGFVAVEVVLRHVQHRADLKPRLSDRLELKAAQLQHHPVLRVQLLQPVEHGFANIAAADDVVTTGPQHLGGQGCGGGLAVRPRDAGDRTGAALEEEIHLTGDFDSALPCRFDEGRIPGDAGADHQKVHRIQVELGGTELTHDPVAFHRGPQFVGVCPVDDSNRRSLAFEISGRGAPAASIAEDHRPAAIRLDQLTSPGRASTRERMAASADPAQNVRAIRLSRQPETMK